MSRRPISFIRVIVAAFISGFVSLLFVSPSWAIDNAPADAAVINVRTNNCIENGVEVANCFTTMANVEDWLRDVRQTGPTRPTLVQIGPGSFVSHFVCNFSNVTLQGSGRSQTILNSAGQLAGMEIYGACTAFDVQDLTVDASQANVWGIFFNVGGDWEGVTTWTNVDIIGPGYGWLEAATTCTQRKGRNLFFGSRISTSAIANDGISRAYQAACAQSWFWGSEITANVSPQDTVDAFALKAINAEVHLYGSNVRLLLSPGVPAKSFDGNNGHYLMAALSGSSVHIHGTGLDVVHEGSGTADMLYADSTSHFHANESGFNIHVTGTGKVNRVAGPGSVETPYMWGAGIVPPLSTSSSGVQTLASRNGMDSYIETDCPFSSTAACSAGAGLPVGSQYPRLMVYRKECTGTGPNQGPWFDTIQRNCRN